MSDLATTITTRNLGTRWTKSETLDRVYFNAEMLTAMGFEIDSYGSGNIRSAKRYGSKISNNQAAEYVEVVTKAYLNVVTGGITTTGRLKRMSDVTDILKEIRVALNELD
jgi:ABC-type transport system involved in Fe-S cluster assembly fused permease/ATPase subunit